jgi:N6-L-threonylcarbamoyladenine synthase
VVEALLDRTFEAASWLGARSVGIAGGVSANSRLRADAEARGAKAGLPVFVPPLSLSTDNAAMIGAAGLRRLRAPRPGSEQAGVSADWDLNAEASLAL